MKKLYKPQTHLEIEVEKILLTLSFQMNSSFLFEYAIIPRHSLFSRKGLSITPNIYLGADGLISVLLQLLTFVQLSLTS